MGSAEHRGLLVPTRSRLDHPLAFVVAVGERAHHAAPMRKSAAFQ
jgi:hypothetical protein